LDPILLFIMTSLSDEKKSEIPYYPVLIIGAGATGIAAGSQLKQKLGLKEFRIFDRQSGIGGEFCESGFIAALIKGWW
jgi:ribulose 1,5-bisphosphate synthetase/thiazole synthase